MEKPLAPGSISSSIVRIEQVLAEIEQGAHAIKGTGSHDFGRGMSHAAKLMREVLDATSAGSTV